jgi:hypothetical protein
LLLHRGDRGAAAEDFPAPGIFAKSRHRRRPARREMDALQVDGSPEPSCRVDFQKHDRGLEAGQRNAEGLRTSQSRLLRSKKLSSSVGCALTIPVGYHGVKTRMEDALGKGTDLSVLSTRFYFGSIRFGGIHEVLWVKPEQPCGVEFVERTKSGRLRHAEFRRLVP